MQTKLNNIAILCNIYNNNIEIHFYCFTSLVSLFFVHMYMTSLNFDVTNIFGTQANTISKLMEILPLVAYDCIMIG